MCPTNASDISGKLCCRISISIYEKSITEPKSHPMGVVWHTQAEYALSVPGHGMLLFIQYPWAQIFNGWGTFMSMPASEIISEA